MSDLILVRGVGPAMEQQMRAMGLSSARDLAQAEPEALCALPRVQLVRARLLILAAAELLGDVADAEQAATIPSADPSVDRDVLAEVKQATGKKSKSKKDKTAKPAKDKKKKKKPSTKSASESAKAKMKKAGKATSARSKDKKAEKKAAKKAEKAAKQKDAKKAKADKSKKSDKKKARKGK
ncbi:helix-hairpin-helix domain-containing protein [Sagittula sp. SSi028]|uniref:helix-hairpin-helix domain-containing protein n=1 Tax=Sagittula sp. SSi028 TaxID=3400636 RepID=UPI003AF7B6B5